MSDDFDDGGIAGDDNSPKDSAPKQPGYEVGFGKPPEGKRFKPGQSGNPNGRPKGTLNLRSDLEAELGHKVTIPVNGKPVMVSRQRFLLRVLVQKAAEGDIRAAEKLLNVSRASCFSFEVNARSPNDKIDEGSERSF